MNFKFNCLHCDKEFYHRKNDKKFCSHKCYSQSRRADVKTYTCKICNQEFTRKIFSNNYEYQYCSGKCQGQAKRSPIITKSCKFCNKEFDVRSCDDNKIYCNIDCFHEDTKAHEDVTLICKNKNCKKEFKVIYYKREKQFCSRTCATSGEYNSMFGKPGSMCGKRPWHYGKTKETDERLKKAADAVSQALKNQFASGKRSHIGERNPAFGRTRETRTQEQLENYSKAATKRIQDGVSGYGTFNTHTSHASSKILKTFVCRSSWEKTYAEFLDSNPHVLTYEYETLIIPYENNTRRYTPDFLVTYVNGSRELIEIKPKEFISDQVNLAKFKAAKDYCAKNNIKFKVLSTLNFDFLKRDVHPSKTGT